MSFIKNDEGMLATLGFNWLFFYPDKKKIKPLKKTKETMATLRHNQACTCIALANNKKIQIFYVVISTLKAGLHGMKYVRCMFVTIIAKKHV